MCIRVPTFVLVVLAATACKQATETPASDERSPTRVTCVPVTRANVEDTVEVTGVVAPPPRLDATISSPVAGRIARLAVEEGDTVEEGALVAVVEDPSLPAGKVEATADVARARANKIAADQDLARQQRLVSSGIGAQRDLDEAKARASAAIAELNAAQARAGLAVKNNARRELRAPHAGVVLQLWKHVGESVDGTAATPVARIADVSRLELHAQLAASSLQRIRAGMPVRVQLVGSTESLPASVVRVSPAVDPATLLGSIRIQLDGTQGIPVGSAASAAIVSGTRSGLLVPATAVRRSAIGSDELVVCEGSVARVRGVTVGKQRDGSVEIAKGLANNEQVVADHVLGLEDGQPLTRGSAKTP